jgi:hypothetical protein
VIGAYSYSVKTRGVLEDEEPHFPASRLSYKFAALGFVSVTSNYRPTAEIIISLTHNLPEFPYSCAFRTVAWASNGGPRQNPSQKIGLFEARLLCRHPICARGNET